MSLYNGAFWSASFFLLGVLAASVAKDETRGVWIAACVVLLAAAALALCGHRALALAALCGIIGAFYFHWRAVAQHTSLRAPLGELKEFSVLVLRVRSAGQSQRVTGELQLPHAGVIQLTLNEYPVVRYGDVVAFSGTLQSPDPAARDYFFKEGVAARAQFPKDVRVVAREQGGRMRTALFDIRDYVQARFEKIFAPAQAMLMTGLVLGKSGGFSREFTEKLQATGTTHIVALSGYNISVIVNSLLATLGFFINRRYAVWISVAAIVGFVVMTGAEASVVRAAIMATILIIAERSERTYSVRNAIVMAALVMTLANPAVLVFDVGFQLSFFALLGIVYVEPALKSIFRFSSKPGFLGWRANLLTTTAAQLAVLPILLSSFGFFPPLAILTNVLVLTAVPYTMSLGFFVIIAGLISGVAAQLVALPAQVLLGYELAIIDFFSRFSFGIQVESLPLAASLAYYAALIGCIIYAARRRNARLPV